jgi:hypothetical protein
MQYAFDTLEVQNISKVEQETCKVVLLMSFSETESALRSDIRMEVAVPADSKSSAAQTETLAFERAKALVSAAAERWREGTWQR